MTERLYLPLPEHIAMDVELCLAGLERGGFDVSADVVDPRGLRGQAPGGHTVWSWPTAGCPTSTGCTPYVPPMKRTLIVAVARSQPT